MAEGRRLPRPYAVCCTSRGSLPRALVWRGRGPPDGQARVHGFMVYEAKSSGPVEGIRLPRAIGFPTGIGEVTCCLASCGHTQATSRQISVEECMGHRCAPRRGSSLCVVAIVMAAAAWMAPFATVQGGRVWTRADIEAAPNNQVTRHVHHFDRLLGVRTENKLP